MEDDLVLVAHNDFSVGEKLSPRWRGLGRFIKALSNYVYQAEVLSNGPLEDVRGSRLKFYHGQALNIESISPMRYCLKRACRSNVLCLSWILLIIS